MSATRARGSLPALSPRSTTVPRRYLLMEFVEGSSRFSQGAERHAAELLGALHGITADAYGHERDTLIGSLDQPNPWTGEAWVVFREQRPPQMARIAHDAGRLLVGTCAGWRCWPGGWKS